MVQKHKVVMSRSSGSSTRPSGSSNLKTTFKGVLYDQLNGYDDSDNEETTLYNRGPEIHGNTKQKSTTNAQSKRNFSTNESSKTNSKRSKNRTSDYSNQCDAQSQISATRTRVQNDGNIELSEMRSRKSATNMSKICDENEQDKQSFIERSVSQGDTLQSLALKYSCQVAEIKRINNLIQDQEFYALQKVKVPARQHGLLQEMVEREEEITHTRLNNGDTVINGLEANDDEGESDSEYPDLLVRTVSIRDAICNQSKEAQDFLQKMDKDINGIVQSTRTRLSSLDEVKDYLTAKRIRPMKKQSVLFSGVDCGMRWWSIFIWVLIILLLAPLGYSLYAYLINDNPNEKTAVTTIPPQSPTESD